MNHYVNINPTSSCYSWLFINTTEFAHKNTDETLCLLNELDYRLYDMSKVDIKPITEEYYNLLVWLASNEDYEAYNKLMQAITPSDVSEKRLTDVLYYQGLTFYLTCKDNKKRVYNTLDELVPRTIITAPADYDGALIATVDDCFREDEEDDMTRYFDSMTGVEEE